MTAVISERAHLTQSWLLSEAPVDFGTMPWKQIKRPVVAAAPRFVPPPRARRVSAVGTLQATLSYLAIAPASYILSSCLPRGTDGALISV